MSARRYSAWVIPVHSISSACRVDGSGACLAALLGLGSVFLGIPGISLWCNALCPLCLVIGSLGYFRAPVDQLRNWYVSVGELSSSTFPENCLFFRFILRLNVMSAVRYSLSTCWGATLFGTKAGIDALAEFVKKSKAFQKQMKQANP